MDDVPPEENTGTADHLHNREVEDITTKMPDHEPLAEDIMPMLASALLDGGETSDTASLAVSAGMSGPLPPPWILEGYNQTIPNGANRIMTMAEKGQTALIADRQEQRRAERRGQIRPRSCLTTSERLG